MSTPQTPVMIRAAITQDEWHRLRQLALAQRRAVQTLVADALRATYNLNPNGDTTDDHH